MNYRKLRIAWSIGCGFVCVLFVVLWVRSYWIVDFIQKGFAGPTLMSISIEPGTFCIFTSDESYVTYWTSVSIPADEYLAGIGAANPPPPSRVWGYSYVSAKALALPFWFLTLIAAALATVPWLQWRRFSLRTLLIATTLVTVVLGLLAVSMR